MAAPNKKVDSNGNLYFNQKNLAWFGLDHENSANMSGSLSVSPFSGWGDDKLPEHIKYKVVPKTRYELKGVGKSLFYMPTGKVVRLNKRDGRYQIKFTLFGKKTIDYFFSHADKEVTTKKLKILVTRRDELHENLFVKKGHKDKRFKEYVMTGCKDLFNELKSDYDGVKPHPVAETPYFKQVNKSRTPRILKRKSGYYCAFSLFGSYPALNFSDSLSTDITKAEAFRNKLIENRNTLYKALEGKVKRGEKNPLFKEYVMTGNSFILEDLKKQYV